MKKSDVYEQEEYLFMEGNDTQDQGDALRNGTVITDIDEICAAIRATRDGVSMFSGTFGPGGLQGKLVTPNDKMSLKKGEL